MNNLLGGGTLLCLVGGVVLVAFVLVAQAIRVVPEYQRLVVFRLGRCIGPKGPGIIFLIPVVYLGRFHLVLQDSRPG